MNQTSKLNRMHLIEQGHQFPETNAEALQKEEEAKKQGIESVLKKIDDLKVEAWDLKNNFAKLENLKSAQSTKSKTEELKEKTETELNKVREEIFAAIKELNQYLGDSAIEPLRGRDVLEFEYLGNGFYQIESGVYKGRGGGRTGDSFVAKELTGKLVVIDHRKVQDDINTYTLQGMSIWKTEKRTDVPGIVNRLKKKLSKFTEK